MEGFIIVVFCVGVIGGAFCYVNERLDRIEKKLKELEEENDKY